jgi:twitching motility protein PilT
MSLVPSLLQAIVRIDGEALVMHAGDKPYVVAPTGQVDLANRGLTLDAVSGIVNQLLPAEMLAALNEFGAIQYELPAMPEFPGEHFTAVAARGGDDLWVEIRRHRVDEDDLVPEEMFARSAASAVVPAPVAATPQAASQAPSAERMVAHTAAETPSNRQPVAEVTAAPQPAASAPLPRADEVAAPAWQARPIPPVAATPMADEMTEADLTASLDEDDDLHLPDASQLWPARPPLRAEEEEEAVNEEIEIDLDADVEEEVTEEEPAAEPIAEEEPIQEPIAEPWAAIAAEAAPVEEPVEAPQPLAEEEPVEEAPVAPPMAADMPFVEEPIAAELAHVAEPIEVPQPVAIEPIAVEEPVGAEEPVVAEEVPAPPALEEPVAPAPEPVFEPFPAVAVEMPQVAEPVHVPMPVAQGEPVVAAVETLAEEEPVVPAVEPVAEPLPPIEPGAEPLPAIAAEAPHAAEPVKEPEPLTAFAPAAAVAEPVVEPAAPLAAEPPRVAARVAEPPPVAEPRPASRSRLSVAMEKRRAAAAGGPPAAAVPPSAPPVAPPPPSVYTPERVAASAPSATMPTPEPAAPERPPLRASAAPPPAQPVAPPVAAHESPRAYESAPPQPGVVLPIARSPIRAEQPPPYVPDPTLSGLERLLRVSAARGASTLYLSSGSRPSVRVDGELQVLEGEPVHVARDVESLLLTLMPERSHEALRSGAATEWIVEIEGVGRVRCMSFRDHLGPGGVFRMMPTRSISADQLALPRQVQSLAIEPEGIVLVAGPRSSGKRTLIAAFVDLMNRTRRDHIITIEREINIVHERGLSFISQREVRGHDDDLLTAARAALREDPDVLVIEDLRTGPLMNVALEAAASGRLVVGGFSAHTATGAIDRIIDLYAPEYRRQVQLALADSLRGVIVQTLLRKVGGGRLPAREVLLNTPAVSAVIAEGKTSQLPMAIEGGRRYGMIPLNDALVGLVQNGSVEAREAYRRSPDRPGFLAALNRHGLDTSFVERLA